MAHDSGLDDETMQGGTPDDLEPVRTHTPGPWLYDAEAILVCDAAGRAVADPLNDKLPPGEVVANGTLVAAAPDLLEALGELLVAYEDGVPQCHCANGGHAAPAPCVPCKARAAVRKARGG